MPVPLPMERLKRLQAVWKSARAKRVGLALLFSVLVAAFGLELNRRDLAFVETFDKMTGDWRIALGSPRASDQRTDIAIVLVTDETLRDYESRSPIDRVLIAELIQAVDKAGPRAIAIDLILDRRTKSDDLLLAAFNQAKAPIILGSIDERVLDKNGNPPCESLSIQADLLKAAGKPYGHLMLERKSGFIAESRDNTVRFIAGPPAAYGAGRQVCRTVTLPPAREAFSDTIARSVGITPKPGRQAISWLRSPANGYGLFTTLPLPRHDPKTLQPALNGLVTDSMRESWKGRVVLIGADLMDQDQHMTPLSVIEGPVAGVAVHAQALAQRIDGNRDVVEWPWWANVLVVALVAFACFSAARERGINPHGLIYGLVGLILIGLASGLAFRWRLIEIPSIALATAWAVGGFGGFISEWVYRRLGLAEQREGK
jgi:adenylate cyclase